MGIVFKNNAKTTLASSLSNSATSATVTDGSVFPSLSAGEFFLVTFDDGTNNEICKCTARSGNTLTIVRAQESTTARAFSSGDAAEGRVTAGVLETIQENIAAKSANQTVFNTTTSGGATTYNIGTNPGVEANAMVFLNGVLQHHDTLSFSGTNLTFDAAPVNGMALEVIIDNLINLQSSNLTVDTFTAADVSGNPQTDFVLSDTPAAETNLIVFVDGVFQDQDSYTISSNTLTITDGVIVGRGVTVYVINPVNIGTPSDSTVTSAKLSGDITMPGGLIVGSNDVAFDSPTFVVDNANSRVGLGTASPSVPVDIVGDVKMSANLTVDTTTLVVDSSNNRVGIGTASPAAKLEVAGGSLDINGTDDLRLRFLNGGTFKGGIQVPTSSGDMISGSAVDDLAIRSQGNILFSSGGNTEHMRIQSGNVGINTTNPSTLLHLGGTAPGDSIIRQDSTSSGTNWEIGERSAGKWQIFEDDNDSIVATFMSTGNVGIGTATPSGKLQVQMSHTETNVTLANNNETLVLGNSGTGNGVYNAIKFGGNQQDMYIMSFNNNQQADRRLGFFLGSVAGDAVADERLSIRGNGSVGIGTTSPTSWASYTDGSATVLQVADSSQRARIVASGGNGAHLDLVDANGGSNDKHLNFSVDGGVAKFGSLTDAGNAWVSQYLLQMDLGDGMVSIGDVAQGTSYGFSLYHDIVPAWIETRSSSAGHEVMILNRQNSSGTMMAFLYNGNEKGTISQSGGTISYNPFMGSHYSESSEDTSTILHGTVMETVDALVENKYKDEKRLAKCKVSSTSESTNVYGVWMEDNETGQIAALGASWCRINGDVEVSMGDLLVSNGDGTAKVQSDDILRSKTIGKVTSTVKKETYSDGSYVVPVVLYCG